MTINCIDCGEPIDIGRYKDDDEREHKFDTFDHGEAHLTIGIRRGFRASGGVGRLHIECFEELFDTEVNLPEWAEGEV